MKSGALNGRFGVAQIGKSRQMLEDILGTGGFCFFDDFRSVVTAGFALRTLDISPICFRQSAALISR